MSIPRTARLTLTFVAMGAVAGATAALLSLAPIWLGLTQLPRNFIQGWPLVVVGVVGAICGSVVMPALGLLVSGRRTPWRAAVAVLGGAVLGETIAALSLSSLQTDMLVIGAFVGALTATLVVRLMIPARVSPPAT